MVAMREFHHRCAQSVLRPGEIIEAIHVPAIPASAHWGYVKACHKTGEFARAIGAIEDRPECRRPPAS